MSKQSDCKTEAYSDNSDILFRYVMTDVEKNDFCEISYDVINKCKTSEESKKFVTKRQVNYESLLMALTMFFTEKPGSYFLRLSTISPKDAYYYLNKDSIDYNDLSDDETADEIKHSLNILKVSSPMECIQVLFHSFRVLCELNDNCSDENAVLLMPWKNIAHDTETRCYVNNKKLIAISQYYTDCVDSYTSIKVNDINLDKFYYKIIEFVNNFIINMDKELLPNDFVIDMCQKYDSNDIMMIELNIYDRNTDSCLFTWDEIDDLCNLNLIEYKPVFRYMKNKKLVEICG
jgi:hypothetical protein